MQHGESGQGVIAGGGHLGLVFEALGSRVLCGSLAAREVLNGTPVLPKVLLLVRAPGVTVVVDGRVVGRDGVQVRFGDRLGEEDHLGCFLGGC